MKEAVELVAGKKLTGVSGRKVHKMRRDAMKPGPVTEIKYDKGVIQQVLQEKGASDWVQLNAQAEAIGLLPTA